MTTQPSDTRADAAAWLWSRLRAAGRPLSVGQLVAEARDAGLLAKPTPEQPKPKLTALYKARRRVAAAHPGWHVGEVQVTAFGLAVSKMWTIASGPDPNGPPDYDMIRRTVDLARVVEADLGPAGKGGRWPCPIHGGEGPNFGVKDGRWKCWTCGASGDVIDYVAARDRVSVAEAVAKLDPLGAAGGPVRIVWPKTPGASRAEPERADKPAGRSAVWHDPEWQTAVESIVRQAEQCLWSPEGRPPLDWLRRRGFADATISRFRLGFLPRPATSEPLDALGSDRDRRLRRVFAPRGVTFPWVAPGAWYDPTDGACDRRWVGCNVRRLPEGDLGGQLAGDKYKALAGSERGHGYPWPEPSMPAEAVILCEGEIDALTAWQEAGWVANVATFGGAGQRRTTASAKAFLAACPDWLLLFDRDEAGDDAARDMTRRGPHRCRRLLLECNDLNDLVTSGGSVLDFLRAEWERFGWEWPWSRIQESRRIAS